MATTTILAIDTSLATGTSHPNTNNNISQPNLVFNPDDPNDPLNRPPLTPVSLRPGVAPSLNYLYRRIVNKIYAESTFFRLHLVAFTFIPLITSGIFYACNGRFRVSYLNSLFMCYSAMTVCGLSVLNLSTLTVMQQVILYFLMMIGDITTVAWIMVLVRKHYFRTRCEYIVSRRPRVYQRKTMFITDLLGGRVPFTSKDTPAPLQDPSNVPQNEDPNGSQARTMVNPTPEVSSEQVDQRPRFSVSVKHPTPRPTLGPYANTDTGILAQSELEYTASPTHLGATHLPQPHLAGKPAAADDNLSETGSMIDRMATFTSSPTGIMNTMHLSPEMQRRSLDQDVGMTSGYNPRVRFTAPLERVPYPRRKTTILANPNINPTVPGSAPNEKYRNHGGFPSVAQLTNSALRLIAPNTHRQIKRKMTVSYDTRISAEQKPYLKSDIHAGRNSNFHTEDLSDEEVEQIGGVEYRALRWLSYLVPMYFVGTQLIAYLLFSPWLSTTTRYDDVFNAQPRLVSKPWFGVFQMMAAYTGGGLSLVDAGMLPFQEAYLLIFAMIFVILAGNHAKPIILRFIIWICSKISRKDSEAYQAFSFLLDHPRRCFIYLFPSHQTWFLLLVLVLLSAVEWGLFPLLNTGLDVYNNLPRGARVLCGLLQGLAARASGFSVVNLSATAPALQFLYVVMMYIAIYPIAMSIRATNVYEERSLGVYEHIEEDEDEEPADGELKKLNRRERIGRYVNWHVRRQLSVDIWWLVWGVFFIAIIERKNLMAEDKKWFDMFRVLFELVSAFGGIGLSLGFPSDNFSFVGTMRPLSKLIVIIIMVRGRHRGLPVAVDKAVLLPTELTLRNHNLNKAVNSMSPTSNHMANHEYPAMRFGPNGV